MATALQNLIDAYIKRNANQEITGPVLNGVLTAIANALGTPFVGSDGYWYTYDAETGQFVKTDTPAQGETGPVGVTEAAATIDDQIGTPSVAVSLDGTRLDFTFRNLKGQKGDTGDAGITAAVVTVDAGIGTPSVDTSITGTTLTLAFHNLKGETGAAAGFGTIEATVDDTTGTPAVVVTESGPDTAKNLSFAFSGLKGPKGDQGNTGVSADYPITIANNLTTDDPTAALAASQGVVLQGEIDQLGQKVDDISTGKYYGYYATAADLPETGVDGFAYVGSGPTYTIYNRRNGTWTSSGVTVNQSPIGNEEDIDQNASGKLQFADRIYNTQQPNGMGYVILRKNKTFAEQVTEANTIYEIRYDFDLSADFTMPAGCVLRFNGGSISGAYTFTGANTGIDAKLVQVFGIDLSLSGSWDIPEVLPEWFGAIGDGITDDTAYIQKALDFCTLTTKINACLSKNYKITSTIFINRPGEERGKIMIFGGGRIIGANGITLIKATNPATSDILFSNISFEGNNIAFDLDGGKFIRLWVEQCTFNGFAHSFYSSSFAQDIHLSNCTFLANSNYIIYISGDAYSLTVNNCVCEQNNYAFLYAGGGQIHIVGNTFEGFVGEVPVIQLNNGAIVAISNYLEYNKGNFITLGDSTGTIYGCIIANNKEMQPQSTSPTVIIVAPYQKGVISIYNNVTVNNVFQNSSGKKVIAYGNNNSGVGKSFGNTLFSSSDNNDVDITPIKKIYSAETFVSGSPKSICKIDNYNAYVDTLKVVKIVGSLYNVGPVYYDATIVGNTKVSENGTPDLVSLVDFSNNTLTIGNNSGNSFYYICVEIYGKCYFTDYINNRAN